MGKFVKINDAPEREVGNLSTGETPGWVVSQGSKGRLVRINAEPERKMGDLNTVRKQRAGVVTERDFQRHAGLRRDYGTYENYLDNVKTYDGFTPDELNDDKLGAVLERQSTISPNDNASPRAKRESADYLDKDSDAYKLYQAWQEGNARQKKLANAVTESEFNRSNAMQEKYGTYNDYIGALGGTGAPKTEYYSLLSQTLSSRPDFPEKSKYKSTANGKEKMYAPDTMYLTETGYDDILYDYINGNEDARYMQAMNDVQTSDTHKMWDELPRWVIETFNYLYAEDEEKGDRAHTTAYEFINLVAPEEYTILETGVNHFIENSGIMPLTTAAISGVAALTNDDELKIQNKQARTEWKETLGKSAQQHPIAATAGGVTGSMALMATAGAGTSGLVAGINTTVGATAARGAITYAMTAAVQQSGDVTTGIITPGQYGKKIFVQAAQGAAGNIAGELVSIKIANVLSEKQLMTPFMEFIRQTSRGVADSLTGNTVSYLLSEEKPTSREIAENLVTSFAFSVVFGAVDAQRTVSEWDAETTNLATQLGEVYTKLCAEGTGLTPEAQVQYANKLSELTQELQTRLRGRYVPGQQEKMDQIDGALTIIDGWLKGFETDNGYSGIRSEFTAQDAAGLTKEIADAITTGTAEGLQSYGAGGREEAPAAMPTVTQPAGSVTQPAEQVIQPETPQVMAPRPGENVTLPRYGETVSGQETAVVKSLTKLIKENIPAVADMPSVAEVKGNELPTQGTVTERLLGFIRSIGGKVTRHGFGDVLFSKNRIKGSVIGHGIGNAKIETFAAVPQVIQHGKQVDHQSNWKGRGYDTYTFMAPITYRGNPTYLGVIVAKDNNSNRYYLHEVADEDGNIIYTNRGTPDSAPDARASQTGAYDSVAENEVPASIIPQEAMTVNGVMAPRPGEEIILPGGTNNGEQTQDIQRNGNGTEAALAGEDAVYGGDAGGGSSYADAGRPESVRPPAGVKGATRENRALTFQRQKAATDQPYISPASLGIDGGGEEATMRILAPDDWDDELRGLNSWLGDKGISEVHMVVGTITVDNGGGPVDVLDVIKKDTGELFLRVDSLSRSATETGVHAAGHYMADEEKITRFMNAVKSRKNAVWEPMYEKYMQKWAQVTNYYEGMTEAEKELYVWEEILGDAYANINNMGTRASAFHDIAEAVLEGTGEPQTGSEVSLAEGENAAAAAGIRGPPRYMTAGEIEARETANRWKMTAEERRNSLPYRGDENTVFADGNGNVSLELIGKTDDGIEVYETSEEIRALPWKKRKQRFLDIMQGEYRGRTAKFTKRGEVYYAKFDELDLQKNIYGDNKSTQKGRDAKINTGADGNIFELVENATYKGSGIESGKPTAAHKDVTGWEYFVKTVQIDGQVYDLLANIREKPDGEYVYSIQLNENKKTPASPVAVFANSNPASEKGTTDVSVANVSQERDAVKGYFDENGRFVLPRAAEEDAADEAPKQTANKNNIRFSVDKTRDMTIREQMKEYRAGRLTSHDEFYYGNAPTALDTAGLKGRPLVMSQTDFKKAKSEKHNVPTRAMAKLVESLGDPILSFETGDKIGILTKDIDGDGKPLLVAIMKNVDLDGEAVNRIKSAYGLDNPQAWIGNQIREGKGLRIFDNKKANSFLDEFGYKAERPEDYRLGDIVTGVHEKVKPMSPSPTNRYAVDDDQAAAEKKKKKEVKPVAKSRPIIAKKELRQNMMNIFSIPAGSKNMLGDMVDQVADKLLETGTLSWEERKEFFDRMYDSGVMTVAADEYSRDARDVVLKRKIYVPESVKHEFGGSEDYNEFRKTAFAAGVYLTNNKSDEHIDTLNMELAERLPGLFDAKDLDMTEILKTVVQVAEEGKSQKMSLAEYTAELAGREYVSEDEVLDNLERQVDWALRTFAEKAKLEVTLRDRTGVKLAQQREAFGEMQSRQREREQTQRLKERDARKEQLRRQRENRELRELQQKTLKNLQWLKKNRNKAPAGQRETWDEVLGDIDIYAVGAANEMRWSEKYQATWKDLAQMYKDAQANDPNFLPSKELERIVARVDYRKLADMDIDALNDLYKAAVGLRTEFYNRNRLLGETLNAAVDEVYQRSKGELEFGAGGKAGAAARNGSLLDKFVNMEQLSPMNVMERMAGWNPESSFYSMAKQLEKGEKDIRAYTVKAQKQLKDFLTENADWVKTADGQGKDGVWYELEVPELLELGHGDAPIFGDSVKVYMTPSQKVHMYLESKNYDNLLHMAGGRTFPNKELYSQGKRREAFAQGKTIRLAPETVKGIVSDLTAEEQALANALEKYYNDFAAGEINRVSNILYGYDKAMSSVYAPIYTNSNYTKSEIGVYEATAEGVGNLKERLYSKNPSYNIGAFDAFERHVEQTARFVGMAIPARNWQTLLNWREAGNSMKDVISHTWGDASLNYISDLIQTLQGGKGLTSDSVSTFTDKLFSNYISAVFGANLSIVFKQLGSIPLASAYLGLENFPSLGQVHRVDREFIGKYTQELDWRTLGYATPETKMLKENPNWSQSNKAVQFAFGGGAITAMDGWAASVLWPWAENTVRREFPDLEVGTQEEIDNGTSPFYKKVAELFDEAVARSQSTSDEMHQGALRKSKNPVTRAFTMFKSDSSQTYNTLRQRLGEAKYYKSQGNEAKSKKSKKLLGAAVIAAIGGYGFTELIEFLINLWKHKGKRYRDEDGELTAESVAKEMALGLVGDLAGIMSGGEELAELIGNVITGDTWYGIDTPGLEQLTDVIETIMNEGKASAEWVTGAANVVKNGGNLPEYLRRHGNDLAGSVKELAMAAATYLPGLPVNNLEAYMLGAVKWIAPSVATAYEDAFATAKKSSLKGLTGAALEQRVGDILSKRGVKTEDEVRAALAELYEAGFTDAVPVNTPGKVSVDGEDRELNAYQQQTYDTVWSGTISGALEELIGSADYQNADNETRAKMIDSLYDYAGEQARGVVFGDYEKESFAGYAEDIIGAGASTAEWAIWRGKTAGMKDAEKYALLREENYPDKVKAAIAGSLMGTEMETESGNPTAYAKMLKALDAGLSMDDYLELRAEDAVDRYLDAVEDGVKSDTARNMAIELAGLEPQEGKKSISDAQKWRAAIDAGETQDEQREALKAIMSESALEKYEIADSYGISPLSYVRLKEILPGYDADGNGSYSQAEITAAIDSLGGASGGIVLPGGDGDQKLTLIQQAALWQLYTGSKSAKNNPYSTSIGQQVIDERSGGTNTESLVLPR